MSAWSPDEKRSFKQLCDQLKTLPAFRKVTVKRVKMSDHGQTVYNRGKYYVTISTEDSFSSAVYTLAHECAHILVDMDNAHGPIFGIAEDAMRHILFILLSRFSDSPPQPHSGMAQQ